MKLNLKQLRKLIRETIEDISYNKTMENQTPNDLNTATISTDSDEDYISITFKDKSDGEYYGEEDGDIDAFDAINRMLINFIDSNPEIQFIIDINPEIDLEDNKPKSVSDWKKGNGFL